VSSSALDKYLNMIKERQWLIIVQNLFLLLKMLYLYLDSHIIGHKRCYVILMVLSIQVLLALQKE